MSNYIVAAPHPRLPKGLTMNLPRFTYLKPYAADALHAGHHHFTIVVDGVEFDGLADTATGELSGVVYWDSVDGDWLEMEKTALEFELLPRVGHCDQCEEFTILTTQMFHYSFIASYLCGECVKMEAAHLI